MNNVQLSIIWPLYLLVNILILSVVYYFTLDTVISVFTSEPADMTLIESVCCAVVTLAVRGMFNVKLE